MLTETLAMLAAAGGTAVVQAAGKDAWEGFRQQLARWFGRGNPEREQAELERLEQSAQALEAAEGTGTEQVRIRQEAIWQARIEGLLENLDDAERARAADALRLLLAQTVPGGSQVSAGAGGAAAGGNITAAADRGSIAATVIHGGARIGTCPPQEPDPDQSLGGTRPPTPDPPQG
ncbi:hypothetical protein OG592_02415 [Streptomyces avidinii]|uniref:hypothetical protein n=1 Tax=Streptomyces avidinii TaxID=1895 RepID=UPI0038684DB7|nr:hypothetical protein OG592_02415 [Streptomyces avidinii]